MALSVCVNRMALQSHTNTGKARALPVFTPYPLPSSSASSAALPSHKRTGWLRYLWYAFWFASLSTVIIVALVKHVHKRKHQGVSWPKAKRSKDSNFCDSALWTHDPDGVQPIDAFRHVSQASFEFPVSAHLVFTAEGEPALAHGTIEIDDSGEAGAETVNVDITAYSNNLRDLLDETKACQLTPTKSPVHGVGIYVRGR